MTEEDFPARSSIRVLCKDGFTRQTALSIQATQKEARTVLEAVLDSLVKALRAGEKVELRRFDTFGVESMNARSGLIARKRARTAVPAKKSRAFSSQQRGDRRQERLRSAGAVVAERRPR